ncbi:MAG TPA: GNAT family N-acetyltransferase [Hanamia sp.]|nr:GNAT family N-acetyltransferase [Hanamia sp.]
MEYQYSIRLVNEDDAEEISAIYKFFVEQTIITFEYNAPSSDDFLERIRNITAQYPWLVFLFGNKIIGYAYASLHRQRSAYQWSFESTVYLLPEFHRKGIARLLYKTLFSLLDIQGYFNVYAGVSLPNEKSVGFHTSIGFTEVGIYKNIGYKFGSWHDVEWFQFKLKEHALEPPPPVSIRSISNSNEVKDIFVLANQSAKKIK